MNNEDLIKKADESLAIAGWKSYPLHYTVTLPPEACDVFRKNMEDLMSFYEAMARTRALTPRITFVFRWYDFYIGAYLDREKKILYVFPVPMLGLKIRLGSRKNWFQGVFS